MFAWVRFLDLVDELVQRSGVEAAERTAISRAYYASFCAARRALDERCIPSTQTGRGHAVVWTLFHDRRDTRSRRIADRGRRLRQWRSKADYDGVFVDLSVTANLAVELARGLANDLAATRP